MPETNQEYYSPAFYFGCDQYNDKVITDFMYRWWDKSYTRSRTRQREFSEYMSRTIPLISFRRDSALNQKLKIPARTYTYRMNDFKLPIVDKKLFIKKYGNFNKAIALKTILQDKQVFGFGIDCSIGQYGFPDLYLYPTVYNYTYAMIIPISTTGVVDDYEIYNNFDGNNLNAARITQAAYDNLLVSGAKVTIQWVRHGSVYRAQGRLLTYINTVAHTITLPISSALVKYASDPADMNSWDCFITDRANTMGTYLYARGVCQLKQVTRDSMVFTTPSSAFETYVMTNATGSIYMIHRPTRVAIAQYQNDLTTSPIFRLEIPNPVNEPNYLISKFDRGTSRILQTEVLDMMPSYYPDIIDLRQTQWAGNDLLIETYTLPYKDTMSLFDNPIQNYEDAVGSNYAAIVADPLKCPLAIRGYQTTLPNDTSSYPFGNSPVKEDIRAYKLNILNDICHDNPNAYKDLQKFIDNINKRMTYKSGGRDFLKFSDKYTMDNAEFARVEKDDTTYFDELHGYFTYSTHIEDTPSLLYVNGSLVKPTVEYFSGWASRIYYPKSKMDTAMERYTDLEEEARLEPITVEAFPYDSTRCNNSIVSNHIFNSTDEMQKLFQGLTEPEKISINDLVFYFTSTGEIIDKSKFKFSFEVDEYLIKHEDGTEDSILVDKGTPAEYFLTANSELYRTMDIQSIILQEATESIDPSEDIENLPGGYEIFYDKKFNIGDLLFGITDPLLIGVQISVTFGNGFTNREFLGPNIMENDYKVNIGGYIYGNDPRRIEVYHNGALLPEESYTIQFPTTYRGDCVIDLTPIQAQINPESVVNVIVLPMPMKTQTYTLLDGMRKRYNFFTNEYNAERNLFTGADKGITMYQLTEDPSTSDSELINFDNARVFINGMRLSYHDRDDFKIMNQFIVDQTLRDKMAKLDSPTENLSNARLTIKYPSRGLDFFKMKSQIHQTFQDKLI